MAQSAIITYHYGLYKSSNQIGRYLIFIYAENLNTLLCFENTIPLTNKLRIKLNILYTLNTPAV